MLLQENGGEQSSCPLRAEMVLVRPKVVVWRLYSSNGRPLASSAVGYPTASACRANLVFVGQLAPDGLRVQIVHAAQRGFWGWTLLTEDGALLVISSRSYSRRAQAQKSAVAVVALLSAGIWEVAAGKGRDRRDGHENGTRR